MADPEMVPVQDKLNVFVSSRLLECKDERRVASEAIQSINHQPILFEHLGARPYSARALYISRLNDSQFMIAIYRDGYGYVDTANGMEISGLEDEHRFACENEIDALYYIHSDSSNREPKLSALIAKALKDNAACHYAEPEELRGRIRNDLTAAITSRVLKKDNQRNVLEDTAPLLLARITRWAGGLVPRPSILDSVKRMLATEYSICLYGPPGAGKTTIAAEYSQSIGGIFVRATGLSPKDVFAVCAAALTRGPQGLPLANLNVAYNAFGTAWRSASDTVLIVDECEYLPELLLAVERNGGASARKCIVVTSRAPVISLVGVEVLPLTTADIKEFAASSPDASVERGAVEASQALVTNDSGQLDAAIGELKADTRELVTYLALAPAPLSAALLIALRGQDNYGIENLLASLGPAKHLVDDSPRGYRLVHEQIAGRIVELTKVSAQKLKFYATRLSSEYAKVGRYKEAYETALLCGDNSEYPFAIRALRQAAEDGDWKAGISIGERLLSRAIDTKHRDEAFRLCLQLSYALELTGSVDRADEALSNARQIASTLDDESKSLVDEIEVIARARRTLSKESVEALRIVYDRRGVSGREWEQARLGLELSSIYMAAKDFAKSVEVLRPALASFVKAGDEYGTDLTKRNLAASLFAEDDESVEALQLLDEVNLHSSSKEDGRRERAWLCNLLARQYRRAKRLQEAHAAAVEAVKLGEALGDEYLRAINLTNLGNVLADQGDLNGAIEAYQQSGSAAQRCGRRDIEGNASRLAADKLNDVAEAGGPGMLENATQAYHYAEHSIGLLKDSVDHYGLAYAHIEFGRASSILGDDAAASLSFFNAAREATLSGDADIATSAITHASALCLTENPPAYVDGIAQALGVDAPKKGSVGENFVALIEPIVRYAPRGALIRILGTHLCELKGHLEPRMHGALTTRVIELVERLSAQDSVTETPWRVLYVSIVIAALLKSSDNRFLFFKLSQALTRMGTELSAREESDQTQLWTIRLNLGGPVVISIVSLDSSHASHIACLALATFIKAFEQELISDFGLHCAKMQELVIDVASADDVLPTFKKSLAKAGLEDALNDRSCAVTRPTEFSGDIPTTVVLSPKFLDEIKFGEERGGSLQMLFGLTLVEVIHQLLGGEVEEETIRPKVVSLVRRTM